MTNQENSETSALSLKLDGTLQDMDAKTVLTGLELLTKLVASFTDEPVKMGILEEGSAVTGVLAPPAVEAEVLDGIAHLRDGGTIPENWTFKQVQWVRDLTKLESKSGVTGVRLSPSDASVDVHLDASLREAIESIFKKIPLSLGSVTGELYYYSANKGQFHAKLHPVSGGPIVKISFTEELDEELRSGLRGQVSVYGLLKRHPETHVVEEVDARRIRVIRSEAPARSGRGIWTDLKEQGVTVDALMKAIRGENEVGSANG